MDIAFSGDVIAHLLEASRGYQRAAAPTETSTIMRRLDTRRLRRRRG